METGRARRPRTTAPAFTNADSLGNHATGYGRREQGQRARLPTGWRKSLRNDDMAMPDIVEFVTGPQLLGLTLSLAQVTLLRAMYGLPMCQRSRSRSIGSVRVVSSLLAPLSPRPLS